MKRIIIAILLGLNMCLAISCGSDANSSTDKPAEEKTTSIGPSYNQITKMGWLAGKWQNASPEGTVIEEWQKLDDSTMTGKSYFIKGNDTLPAEDISLQQRGADLFYIPTVMDQNGGQPVSFKLTSDVNDRWVFENPDHDFPQKITYIKQPDGSLLAEISGVIEGQEKSQKFPMTRVQ